MAEKVIVSCLKGIYKRSKMKRLKKKIMKAESTFNLNMIQTVKNFVKEQNKKDKKGNKQEKNIDEEIKQGK